MLILFFSIPRALQGDGKVKEIPRWSQLSWKLPQAQDICKAAFPGVSFQFLVISSKHDAGLSWEDNVGM